MGFIGIVLCSFVILLIGYYVFYKLWFAPYSSGDILPNRLPLSKPSGLLGADEIGKNVLKTNGSTVLAFVQLQSGDRTTRFTDQFHPLLYVPQNWYVEISPSPTDKSKTTARLRVMVRGQGSTTTQKNTEIIDLPPIPQQKWVFLAVLREGRRFDVVYDNQIVASHRLENYPAVIPQALSAGDNGLNGSMIHAQVMDRRLSLQEVEQERQRWVDTNGVVMERDTIIPSLFGVSRIWELIASLFSDWPSDTVTKPPRDNLTQWATPYA